MSSSRSSGRPRVCVFIACSIDGYIADASGGLEWLDAAVSGAEDYGYDDFLAGIDLLAMGRATYDHIAHLDPLPFGDRRVEVFTHRPPAERDGVRFVATSAAEAIARWTDEGVGTVYVDGGALIAQFLDHDAVDEMIVTVAPVMIGAGHRLFPGHGGTIAMSLVDVRSWPSGVVQLRYTRAAT